MSESSGSATTVNGVNVEPGKTTRLSNGDLIGFGQLSFRFSASHDATSREALISMNTLGTFRVAVGDDANKGVEIRTEKCRWLLALLGVEWGGPKSVELILGTFWPDAANTRARKNLSYILSQIKDALKIGPESFESLILRTPSTLQLNPERLGEHDFIEVQRLTRSRKALTSAVALERLSQLYQGGFLPTCYEDWADVLRTKLELDVVETLLASAREALSRGEHALVEAAVNKLLELDNTNEGAAGLLMESALAAAKPEQAVAVYESVTKSLAAEGLEPDPEFMKLYYRANLGL